MKSQNKKSMEAKVSQQSKRQPEHPNRPMHVVSESKNAAAQTPRQLLAPSANMPRPRLTAVQPKATDASRKKTTPSTPPVYQPQPTPKVLQAKKAQPRGIELPQQKGRTTQPPRRLGAGPHAGRPIGSGGTVQRSKKQQDIRSNKIYSGQHGGMWYPSGSSSQADKIWQEHGMTSHEFYTGPSGAKTKENIQAYWNQHPTITKSQLAARYGMSLQELEAILAG